MNMTPYLEVNNLTKQFNERLVLENINFKIEKHEFVVVVGASGCGKSTLLRILAGLEQDYAGDILIQGHPSKGISQDKTIIFQEPRLFPWLSVQDNILMGSQQNASSSTFQQLLNIINLSEFKDALPHQLSGGMAQRVAIARGLMAQPQILLLDEPFSALDPITRHKMQQELLSIHHNSQLTTILITHDVEEAVLLADRIIVLKPFPIGIQTIIPISRTMQKTRDSYELFKIKEQIYTLLEA